MPQVMTSVNQKIGVAVQIGRSTRAAATNIKKIIDYEQFIRSVNPVGGFIGG